MTLAGCCEPADPAGDMQAVSGRQLVRAVPGDGLLHPVALGAIALLLLNDHVLKAAFPGLVTGKLSDFAGLTFFPVMLISGWEIAVSTIRRRPSFASHRLIAVTVFATAGAFAAIKLTPLANSLAGSLLGGAQAAVALNPNAGSAWFALDPTDLMALPAVLVGYWIASGRSRQVLRDG
jgi:hypothetical protein